MLNQKVENVSGAVIVALGSNLPGRFPTVRALLDHAVGALPGEGLRVTALSTWWRSKAWPNTAQPDYLNGVALVETALTPAEVLAALQSVERAFGRLRMTNNEPRTLDLDLIAYGRLAVSDPGLVIPHPRAHLRGFVMGPLAELAPDWVHPTLGWTASHLAQAASVGADAAPDR